MKNEIDQASSVRDTTDVASSLLFNFEPPVPTGELLGQFSYHICIPYSAKDTIYQFVTDCTDTLKQAYEAGNIETTHWKDITQRLDNVRSVSASMLTAGTLTTICNVLGAKSVVPAVYADKFGYELVLDRYTNYAGIFRFAQELYRVSILPDHYSATQNMGPEEAVRLYVRTVYSSCYELLRDKWAGPVDMLSADIVLKKLTT